MNLYWSGRIFCKAAICACKATICDKSALILACKSELGVAVGVGVLVGAGIGVDVVIGVDAGDGVVGAGVDKGVEAIVIVKTPLPDLVKLKMFWSDDVKARELES